MTLPPWTETLVAELTTFGLKILGAIAVWINAAGPLLAVRPACHNDHYWQVYFDTNRAIRETFSTAGYPAPEQLVYMRSGTAG